MLAKTRDYIERVDDGVWFIRLQALRRVFFNAFLLNKNVRTLYRVSYVTSQRKCRNKQLDINRFCTSVNANNTEHVSKQVHDIGLHER